ncbi:MAG: dUTP diphosphatase [Oscillospiraceae bacterium]|nr:dUTP diphosphatase [Oscillospiraceae bacterium]
MSILKVKLVREGAQLPKRETPGSAGHDLRACITEDIVIPAGGSVRMPTGIAIEMENANYVAIIASRSSMAYKYGIAMGNGIGVIDSDYRGEISVFLRNNSDTDFVVHPGDRVAQLLLMPVDLPEIVEADELSETQRGAGGFGSTGRA